MGVIIFMMQLKYNVPVEHFAKLTGRSLGAFKRDFDQTFKTSPRKWLQEKRLIEGFYDSYFKNAGHLHYSLMVGAVR